ncbi:putative glyoxalase family protein [Venturia nashicola]|uniref:Putative glyoxalase family protein n=1 Tax=Venturia nashicola TaxID=86259 RepID=A0A4Z1P9X6_9PEZI|nr:putative glyoxalase family protein [Venturia nashicola]TLD29731.1 putative glyoxalase family protein [Venturia nashicola]
MITGIAHINLLVPAGTLDLAEAFYRDTLGLKRVPVPALQTQSLAWFDITPGGQQVHIAFGENDLKSRRHPCFKVASPEALLKLRRQIWEHFEKADKASPQEADKPGEEGSGAKGVEYPQRFFARDYAGNRLEFSL